jgi:GxxExxY protein
MDDSSISQAFRTGGDALFKMADERRYQNDKPITNADLVKVYDLAGAAMNISWTKNEVSDLKSNDATNKSKTIDYQSNTDKNFTIKSLEDFEKFLPTLCRNLFQILGSKQLEATYQRALVLDLKKAGVIVDSELRIEIIYDGESIGTRRADVICIFPNGEVALLELKAVAQLSSEHVHQLHFYMHHFEIDNGYLINFPHDQGFPDLPEDSKDVFIENIICGINAIKLSDRTLRNRHANEDPHIIHYYKSIQTEQQSIRPISSTSKDKVSLKQEKQNDSRGDDKRASVASTRTTWGKTKKGTDCKVCARQRNWCSMHIDQK